MAGGLELGSGDMSERDREMMGVGNTESDNKDELPDAEDGNPEETPEEIRDRQYREDNERWRKEEIRRGLF